MSRPEVISYIKQNFIAVATDDVKYNEHPDKARFERKWLSDLMRGQIQQGMYAASSAGVYFDRSNRGWPDPDPAGTLASLKQAVAKYRALPQAQRILARKLDPSRDRLTWESDAFVKPVGTLDLRITSRGYEAPGVNSFDQRNPMFFHVDRLWFKPSEWRRFLPANLSPGSSVEVTGPARTRIVLLNHMQAGHSAWWESHIVGGSTRSTVTRLQGDQVSLKIVGDYRMRADTSHCKDSYDGQLLAHAVYDRRSDRFVKFDLAMLGDHTVGRIMDNIHKGSPKVKMAAFATINPLKDPDDRMIPQQWKWGYTVAWCTRP